MHQELAAPTAAAQRVREGEPDPLGRVAWRALGAGLAVCLLALTLTGVLHSEGVGAIVQGTATAVFHLALVAPLFVLAAARSPQPRRAWAAAAPVAVVTWLVNTTVRTSPLPEDPWNWGGNLAVTILAAVLLLAWRGFGADETGVTLRLTRTSWLFWLGFATVTVVLGLGAVDAGHASWDEALFSLTLPGLWEELIYRALLLAILDRALGTPWRLGPVRVGWGIVMSSALFILPHVVVVGGSGIVTSELWLGYGSALVLIVVRLATGSVWPAVITHNALNSLSMYPYTAVVWLVATVVVAVFLVVWLQRIGRESSGSEPRTHSENAAEPVPRPEQRSEPESLVG